MAQQQPFTPKGLVFPPVLQSALFPGLRGGLRGGCRGGMGLEGRPRQHR